ncbi:nucleotidyltransferase domain-containing protein [Flexivirga meconopsidis]|uniref:nucleotidyltransferase domain-containing protein n=1 Tax=Flexivirga meconopsidis TaxID=2977121 RepID=UPI002240DC8B
MTDLVQRARAFLAAKHPDAAIAFLGGSAATGDATATSDLDVLVILGEDQADVSYVETSRYDGQLVEAFVYGPAAIRTWTARGRAERRPVLDRLAAEGISLTSGTTTQDWQTEARAVMAAGPAPLTSDEIDACRYALTSLLDDLADPRDAAEAAVVAATSWRKAAVLALGLDRHWLGTGKWLLRELRLSDDTDRFGLIRAATLTDLEQVVAAGRAVLDAAGGPLQAGHLRGSKP